VTPTQALRNALALALLALTPACQPDHEEPAPLDAAAEPDVAAMPDAAPDAEGRPDAAADVDAMPTVPGCAAWRVDVDNLNPPGTSESAVFEDGALVLRNSGDSSPECSSHRPPCRAIKVYQQPLRGDFDITIEISELEGDAGQAALWLSLARTDAIIDYSGIGLLAPDAPGKLRVRRVGDRATFSAETAGWSQTGSPVDMRGDLLVAIGLEHGSSTTPVRARIERFVVESSAGEVAADEFDCQGTLEP
jgi:hypothetical protein